MPVHPQKWYVNHCFLHPAAGAPEPWRSLNNDLINKKVIVVEQKVIVVEQKVIVVEQK